MARRNKQSAGAKVSKGKQSRKTRKGSADLPESLEPFGMLADLPEDVRQMLLNSILGKHAPRVSGDQYSPETKRLLKQADKARTIETRRERLKEVVEYDPDCVEGWQELAACQERPDDAISFLEQAVVAAKRSLPNFEELVGHFYGVWETRPYMMAMRELMDCRQAANLPDEAIATACEMLRLDPDDHMGVRYPLLGMFLESQRRDDARDLLDQYDDDSLAEWACGRLLLAIQSQENEQTLQKLLKAAHKSNPYVLDFLLSRRPMPPELPELISPEEESGAVYCVMHLRRAWLSTPGAISWLREAARDSGLLKPISAADLDEEAFDVAGAGQQGGLDLNHLPDHLEPIWLAGIYELPAFRRQGAKRKKKGWALYAIAPSGPINMDIRDQRPNAHDLWEWLQETMRHGEPPGRPRIIEIPQKGIISRLRISTMSSGIEFRVCQFEPPLDDLFTNLVQQLNWEAQDGPASDEDILALPQDASDAWECDLAAIEQRVRDAQGELRRASSLLVASTRDDLVLAQDIIVTEPDEYTLPNILSRAMLMPLVGEPHRPGEVIVRNDDDRLMLHERLASWNVNVRSSSELSVIDSMREELTSIFGGEDPASLASVPEITRNDLSEFYEAACRFHQDQPWKRWMDDEVILVTCEALQPEPLYALVMGQAGIERGLSFFRDRALIRRMFDDPGGNHFSRISGYSLTFCEPCDVPSRDYDAIEQFGWPVASPEAYPMPIRLDPGPEFSVPTRTELLMLTAVLQAMLTLSPRSEEGVTVSCGRVAVHCGTE